MTSLIGVGGKIEEGTDKNMAIFRLSTKKYLRRTLIELKIDHNINNWFWRHFYSVLWTNGWHLFWKENKEWKFMFSFLGTWAKNGSTQSAFQLHYSMVGEPLSKKFHIYISIHIRMTFKIQDQTFHYATLLYIFYLKVAIQKLCEFIKSLCLNFVNSICIHQKVLLYSKHLLIKLTIHTQWGIEVGSRRPLQANFTEIFCQDQ